MNNALRSSVACLLVLSAAPAFAMYRCGNVFQDKPCETGTQINISPSGRQQAAPAPSAAPRAAAPANSATFAIACSRVGEQAQRIAWKREGGATLDQQLAERATLLSPADQEKTVRGVYARRGSAPDIRSQIEAECMADKEKEAQAQELLKQLRKDAGETTATPQPAATPARAADAAAGAADAATAPNAGSKPSTAHCASLRRSVDDVKSRLVQGGSASQMEYLQRERRSAEAALRSSGCA
jgi:hypothetical protein